MPTLTLKQKKFLEYIQESSQKNGYSPSHDEIRKHFKLASVSTVNHYMQVLQEKGYITREKNIARAVKIGKQEGIVSIPFKGYISAGEPIEAIEEYETTTVPQNMVATSGEHFALAVKGNSMIDEGIFDGDTVIIRKQNTVENGETAVALINGNEVTLKKIFKEKNRIRLQPANPALKPLYVKTVIIQGKVISVLRNFKEIKKDLRFMDFCAGIGAGRLGLENLGLSCIGFSEIDKAAEKTYREFFGQEEKNYGDLMKINLNNLPDFDLMIAGFPCQTFSVIGQRKGMGDHRGQIIYGLIKIMNAKNLPYFILENVKGLVNHDGGRTLKIILEDLDKAGYKVYHRVLNSLNYGVPQMRERIYFVGIRKDIANGNNFEWPKPLESASIKEYLIDNVEVKVSEKKKAYETFLQYLNNRYNKELFKVEDLLKDNYLVIDTRQSDLRLYRNKVPTLRTGRHGILYSKNGKFRKLSGFEALLLQGFPKHLSEKVKDKIADVYLLSQAGNAMTVNTVEAIGKSLLDYINA